MSELQLPPHEETALQRRRVLIIGLAVAAVLCAAAGAFGIRYLARERELATRKTAALQQVDAGAAVEQAIDDLKLVIARHPNDVEAIRGIARAMLHRTPPKYENVVESIRYYNRLLEVDPDRMEDRVEMVRLLDLLGASDVLVKTIEPLILLRPQDPLANELKTRHLVRLSRMKDAESAAKAWAVAAPDDFDAQMTYVSLLQSGGKDQRDADSYLNSKLAKESTPDVVNMVRAAVMLGTNQPPEATKLIDAILAKPKHDPQITHALVASLDQLNRNADADKLLGSQPMEKLDASLVLMSALRDVDRSNYTRATATLDTAGTPEDLSTRAAQLCVTAFLHRRLNHNEEYNRARGLLESLPIEYAAPWLATLQATGGEPLNKDSARELLPQLRVSARTEDGAALVHLATANCLVQLGQYRTADRMLMEASRLPVGWSLCARQLIDLRRSRGEYIQAIEVAQYSFARSGHTIDSAINLALAVASSKPTGTQADGLLQLLFQIQQNVPGEVQTLGLYVDALARRKDPSAAKVLADALGRDTPVPVEYLLQWASLSQQHSLGLEEQCLARATKVSGMSPRIALANATILYRAGKPEEALAQLRGQRDAHPEDRRGYDEAIATYLLQTRSPDAAEAWNTLAAQNPRDVALQERVLDLGFGGSAEQRRALIERIRKIEPNNLAAELADIRLALDEKRDPASINATLLRLNRVVDRVPDLIPARLLLIGVLMQTDNGKAALAQWEKAFALDDSEPAIILSGAKLLIENGDRTRATEILHKIDRLLPNLNAAQRDDAARLYLVLGMVDRTVEILGEVTDATTNEQLLLAEAHYRRGQIPACREILARLFKQPDLDTILFAAAVEDAQGNREGSEALLQRARDLGDLSESDKLRLATYASERGALERVIDFLASSNASNDLTIRIARLWVEQGQVDAAMKALNEAASRSAEAAPLRRRLKEEPQIRRLAQLSMFPIASELLANPDDSAIQQLVQFALSTQLQSVRDQQIALDRLAAQGEKNYTLELFLADRFMAMNQPLTAEKHARVAAEVRTSAPQPMAIAAMAASRAGNTGRCAEAIKDWRNRLPADNTVPDALEARNMARRREYTELLSRFEAKAKTGSVAPEVLFSVAQAMHARGRDAEAIALITPAIQAESRLSITWLTVLGTEFDPAPAAKSLEAFRQIIESRQLPAECVALAIASDRVARKLRTPAVVAAATKSLEAIEATANELPIEAVTRLAENRVERKELAKAEAIYRKALAAREDTAALDNNLAEVLRRESKLSEALEVSDRAIAKRGDVAAMHDTRAAILSDLRRFDDALASAQAAARLDPLNPRWMLRAATIQQAKGDFITARSALEMLRWFFREPDVWSADLIERFHTLEENLIRRPATNPAS